MSRRSRHHDCTYYGSRCITCGTAEFWQAELEEQRMQDMYHEEAEPDAQAVC